MSKRLWVSVAMIGICFGLLAARPALAQYPSLAPADSFEITVAGDNGNETFTIIRDGRDESMFYYVPVRPTVAYEMRNGKKMPIFQLLKWLVKDDKGEEAAGGLLQLSMKLGISPKTLDNMQRKIESSFPLKDATKKHRLVGLPIKNAEVTMYDLGGNMLDQAPPAPGVAPIFGTQHYPFMLKLKKLGADAMEALCRGAGGLPVLFKFSFQGMTPPGGFKVEVNWDNCYTSFSTDTKLAAEVAYKAVGAKIGADFSTLRDKMISEGLIKVTSLSNEAMPQEKIDEVMTPILNLITKELFEAIKNPSCIPPTVAKEIAPPAPPKENPITDTVKSLASASQDAAKSTPVGVQIGLGFSLKDSKIVKKGKFTYQFDRQTVVERTTTCGGALGIGAYPKEIQDQCIMIMPAGQWQSAYFILPSVGSPAELGFDNIALTVAAMKGTQPIAGIKQETVIFKGDSWQDKNGKPVGAIWFPLQAVYADPDFKKNPDQFKFKTTTKITPRPGKGSTMEITGFSPLAVDGDQAMSTPLDLVKPFKVNGECLTYGTGEGEVFTVLGSIKADTYTWNFKLTADNPTQTVLVPITAKSLKLSGVKFVSKKGILKNWARNDKDLPEERAAQELMFFDSDWDTTLDDHAIAPPPAGL